MTAGSASDNRGSEVSMLLYGEVLPDFRPALGISALIGRRCIDRHDKAQGGAHEKDTGQVRMQKSARAPSESEEEATDGYEKKAIVVVDVDEMEKGGLFSSAEMVRICTLSRSPILYSEDYLGNGIGKLLSGHSARVEELIGTGDRVSSRFLVLCPRRSCRTTG